MQKHKVMKKEAIKLLKLGMVGFLLVIVVVLAGEKLSVGEMFILGITPYVVYQLYCAIHWLKRHKQK
jgi:hypothetical protein